MSRDEAITRFIAVFALVFAIWGFAKASVSYLHLPNKGWHKVDNPHAHQNEAFQQQIDDLKKAVMDLNFNAVQREFFIADNYLFCNNGNPLHLYVEPICGDCHEKGVE